MPRLVLVVTDDDPAQIDRIHQELTKLLSASDELRSEIKVEKISSNPLSVEGVIIHTPELCAKGEWKKQPPQVAALSKKVRGLLLSDLSLSTRTIHALRREGIYSLEHLRTITVIDILDTRGLGSGAVVEIARLLAQYGREMHYGRPRFGQDYWHCLEH
jgi:DNA-directed RNA polymerase alpha subunit